LRSVPADRALALRPLALQPGSPPPLGALPLDPLALQALRQPLTVGPMLLRIDDAVVPCQTHTAGR
jgi:hypothetical protein